MESDNDNMRDRLFSQLPEPANLADYRKEVDSLLERNQKKLRQEKWYASAIWFFVVALGSVFLWLGGQYLNKGGAAYFGTLACFWLLFGAVELLKHFINRSRVDLLKEIKQ